MATPGLGLNESLLLTDLNDREQLPSERKLSWQTRSVQARPGISVGSIDGSPRGDDGTARAGRLDAGSTVPVDTRTSSTPNTLTRLLRG